MSKQPLDLLHAAMTNQLVILTVAIVLFLTVITLSDPTQSEAVIGELWT
jgi:hypothetical protein